MRPSLSMLGVHSNISNGEICRMFRPSGAITCSVYTATGRDGPPPQRT